MLDDFRTDDEALDFLDEVEAESEADAFSAPKRRILGMTAPQRFIISILFFAVVCLVGTAALVAFGKIDLPFF